MKWFRGDSYTMSDGEDWTISLIIGVVFVCLLIGGCSIGLMCGDHPDSMRITQQKVEVSK